MGSNTKFCWKCRTDKPLEEYCRGSKDSVCKLCRYELNADWAKNNRDKLRPKRAEYMRKYRLAKSEAKKTQLSAQVDTIDPIKS